MAFNNAPIHKLGAYVPNTGKTLSAPTLLAGDLDGVSFTDSRNEYLNRRWGAVSPKVQIALLGKTASGSLKCSDWSTEVTFGTALTANEALQITVPSAELADNPLAVIVAASTGSGDKKIVAIERVQSEFSRTNTAPSDDLVIVVPNAPTINDTNASVITSALSRDSATAYGVTYFDLDIELGDAGISCNHTASNWETNANNINYKFGSTKSASTVLNINSMNDSTYDILLKFIGYLKYGSSFHYGKTMPLQTVTLDMDENPVLDMAGSKVKSRLIWNCGTETLEAANIDKQYKSKEAIAITLPTYPSVYTDNALYSVFDETR